MEAGDLKFQSSLVTTHGRAELKQTGPKHTQNQRQGLTKIERHSMLVLCQHSH